MNIIEVENLTKHYQSKTFSKEIIPALRNLNLKIDSGKIFGLLGPNGAGKTTLVKILLGIVFPTEGHARIFGEDIRNYHLHSRIGFLPEDHKFPDYLNADELMNWFGSMSGLTRGQIKERADKYLSMVDIIQWRKMKIKKYSKGMLQRLGLAQALINEPELIFLDEPTDGVDPIGRKKIRDILIDLKKEGKTILINSHLLSEVELVCDSVAILNNGVLVKEGSVTDLTISSDTYKMETSGLDDETVNTLLSRFKAVIENRNSFTVKADNPAELNGIIDFLRSRGILITEIGKLKSTLEEMFIEVINTN
jgi:ABC-2 type transport system ATP-binding protein